MKPAIAFLISYAACLGLSCSGANEETREEKHIAFEEAFILSEKITLPKKIFGDLSHLVRADNGDMIIFDMSQSRTWLYLEESYECGYFGHMVPLISEHIVPLSTSDVKGLGSRIQGLFFA